MSIEKKKTMLKIIMLLDCLVLTLIFSQVFINHTKNSLKNTITVDESKVIKTNKFAINKTASSEVPVVNQVENTQTTQEEQPIDNLEPAPVQEQINPNIVYDGLTLEELSAKLDRSLNSTLAGKGQLFASHSLELGLDPYLALAIVLHETGCKWNCSELVKQCNNVGGQKGSPSCGTSGYKAYDTIEEGIIGFMDNLYYNYYSQGLNTPELINTKYASSTAWAGKINNYIETIKAS